MRSAAVSVAVLALLSGSSALAATLQERARIPQSNVQLSANTLSLVRQRLAEIAIHSWEIGTRETALFEYDAPDLFLYGAKSLPPRISRFSKDNLTEIWASVDSVIAQHPTNLTTFFVDGAAGDPASVGIPVLIRNATLSGAKVDSPYSVDATEELEHLISAVPRSPSGAISHRESEVQLWADFLSMAPPFIAYYGALHNNKSLLDEAYRQISLYRSALINTTTTTSPNLFAHILLGTQIPQDDGGWSTGNAWAANGMLRVLRSIQLSRFAGQMTKETNDLYAWLSQHLNTVWSYQKDDGYLLNYIDKDPNDPANVNTTFPEASGTALLAASTFRLATLAATDRGLFGLGKSKVDVRTILPKAEKARQWIVQHVDTTTGYLAPVVDPFDWRAAGQQSPEAQAFVLMLQAAYRDWYAATKGFY